MTEGARDLARASVLLDLKRYDEVASLLARIVAAEPEHSRAWCLLAAAHLGAGRYEEAAAAAGRAVTLAPFVDWPYQLASSAQRHLGKITEAISLAEEACRLATDEWMAYICLAQAKLTRKADLPAAERAAVTALRLAPHEPDAHYTAGRVSYAQGKWKAARAHQERALALDPAHSGALNELGWISLRRGGFPRAAWHFTLAARSAPGDSAYGENAEIPVARVLVGVWLAVLMASVALPIALLIHVPRGPAVLGYTLAIALATGYGTVQLWRMPPETRRLLRGHRAGRVLGALYGAGLIEVISVAMTPARALRPVAIGYATAFAFVLIALIITITALLVSRAIRRR